MTGVWATIRRVRWMGGSARTVTARGHHLRAIYNYKADGTIDVSRSHYTVNGRSVTLKRYRKALDA